MASTATIPGTAAVTAAPRSAEEWLRWAREDPRPGQLFAGLRETGRLHDYPEIAALVDVPQDPERHPEGAVDLHTGLVLDAAAEIAERERLDPETRSVLLFAALTHDFGKATTTRLRPKRGRLRWTSYGHDRAGVPLARQFLERIGLPEPLVARVLPLVRHHMDYRVFAEKASERAVRELAERLAPATIRELGYLIEADHSGRPPLPRRLPEAAARMLEAARRFGLLDGPPPA